MKNSKPNQNNYQSMVVQKRKSLFYLNNTNSKICNKNKKKITENPKHLIFLDKLKSKTLICSQKIKKNKNKSSLDLINSLRKLWQKQGGIISKMIQIIIKAVMIMMKKRKLLRLKSCISRCSLLSREINWRLRMQGKVVNLRDTKRIIRKIIDETRVRILFII